MSHGSIENERVKRSIREAVFALLRKKNFSEITVTDIVSEAGVARASYYRNYESKEDILKDYVRSLNEEIIVSSDREIEKSGALNSEKMASGLEKAFSVFLKNKSYILALCLNGFESYIQDLLDEEIEKLAGDMPANSTDRYKLYFISGSNNNILIHWLKNGAVESPYEIAKVCTKYLKNGVLNT